MLQLSSKVQSVTRALLSKSTAKKEKNELVDSASLYRNSALKRLKKMRNLSPTRLYQADFY